MSFIPRIGLNVVYDYQYDCTGLESKSTDVLGKGLENRCRTPGQSLLYLISSPDVQEQPEGQKQARMGVSAKLSFCSLRPEFHTAFLYRGPGFSSQLPQSC